MGEMAGRKTGRTRSEHGVLLEAADRLIGARLRELRRARGLTQAALGELAGVASQQVAKYETGENALTASRLWLVGRALGVEAAVFFRGIDALLAADAEADARAAGQDEAVAHTIRTSEESVQLAELFRRISNRRTRELLLTLSRELARNG